MNPRLLRLKPQARDPDHRGQRPRSLYSASTKGAWLGSFGCLATQSFHETKNVTCGRRRRGCSLTIRRWQSEPRSCAPKGTNRNVLPRPGRQSTRGSMWGRATRPSDDPGRIALRPIGTGRADPKTPATKSGIAMPSNWPTGAEEHAEGRLVAGACRNRIASRRPTSFIWFCRRSQDRQNFIELYCEISRREQRVSLPALAHHLALPWAGRGADARAVPRSPRRFSDLVDAAAPVLRIDR